MTKRPGLLLFDLDGTLYRGDDPYRFYARELARRLGTPASRLRYLARAQDHLDGREDVGVDDNWAAMVDLARIYLHEGPAVPLPPEAVAESFRATRRCRVPLDIGIGYRPGGGGVPRR